MLIIVRPRSNVTVSPSLTTRSTWFDTGLLQRLPVGQLRAALIERRVLGLAAPKTRIASSSKCLTVSSGRVEGRPATLADGRTIDPEGVLGPPERRSKLVIVGDAETTDGLADLVCGADVLVIEATFLDRDAAIARDYGHLTACEAAALAAMCDVKQLVLTHISGRYTDEDLLAEAKKTFPNSRIAMDFDHIVI
jgi:ribonuclease BN (tRNA processing enzyme)